MSAGSSPGAGAGSPSAGRRRLRGAPRFLAYLALQLAYLGLGLPWIALPLAVLAALAASEGLRWRGLLGRSPALLAMAVLPALFGLPRELIPGLARGTLGGAAFLATWAPACLASARLLAVFASAAWLSAGMSPVELRDALALILRPLGRRLAGRAARSASLAMAFLPWTAAELRRADEAARLRGSDPGRRAGRHLLALSVPLLSRSLEKARRGSEALSLRDPGFGA